MIELIKHFLQHENITYTLLEPLAQSGGDRNYFRVKTNTDTFIVTQSNDVKENKTFFSFTNTFNALKLPVPTIFAINQDQTIYLQQDLGKTCLLDKIIQEGYSTHNFELYKLCVAQLAKLNVLANDNIDYSLCLVNEKFNKEAALFDLHYCQQYYVDAMQIKYDAPSLEKEFLQLSNTIGNISPSYFMYRDCQGRNIMVEDNQIFFIDYQGGMRGPLGYDLASLLWQAKAQLPTNWKQDLLQHYIDEVNKYLPIALDNDNFIRNYYNIVLMRLLQVLGAYGRRGLLEGKAHFISSIPQGITNIEQWMNIIDISNQYPTIHQLLLSIIATKK